MQNYIKYVTRHVPYPYLRLLLFVRWRHYFPRLIQINYGVMFRMKRPWFVQNLIKICVQYF